MIDTYFIHLLIIICLYTLLGLSLQLSFGFTGLLNLGHIGFYAVGAYVSALLTKVGLPFGIGFIAAGLVAALFGYLLSIPSNKLKGDYFAIATWGFSFTVYAILLNWTNLTNGPLGVVDIPKPTLLGLGFANVTAFFILSLIITTVSYLIIKKITISPFGRVLEAIRDDELATKALGKNTALMKNKAMAISAFFAGIAGSLFAHYVTFIDPASFTFLPLITVLSIVIIGGIASLEGTILAAIIITLLPEPLRFLGLSSSMVGPLRQIIYTLLLLAIIMYQPKGFYGKVELK